MCWLQRRFPFSSLPLVCQGSWSRSVAVAGAGLKPTSASRVGVTVLILVRETAADGPSPTQYVIYHPAGRALLLAHREAWFAGMGCRHSLCPQRLLSPSSWLKTCCEVTAASSCCSTCNKGYTAFLFLMRGFGQSLKKQEEPYNVLNQTGSMLPWSHSFPAYCICMRACLLLCAAWPLGELVGKLFVCFSKFADDLALCAALVPGQGNQAGRGSAGQVLLAALFSHTGPQARGFSVQGWKHYSHLCSKFQLRGCFWYVKIDISKVDNYLFVLFSGTKAQSVLMSAGFGIMF